MHGARHQLLARAALATDQHRGRRRLLQTLNIAENLGQTRALADKTGNAPAPHLFFREHGEPLGQVVALLGDGAALCHFFAQRRVLLRQLDDQISEL